MNEERLEMSLELESVLLRHSTSPPRPSRLLPMPPRRYAAAAAVEAAAAASASKLLP